MSFATLMVRPVTIVTAGTRIDDYGDVTVDWLTSTSTDTTGWLSQQSSIEDLDGRDGTSSSLVLFLLPGTPINARSRVVIDTVAYEVADQPTSAWRPSGEHHIEARLRVALG